MASSKEFVEFACERLKDAGSIAYKKMFGEFGVYCEGKIFGVICDNQLFVKITPAGQKLWPHCPQVPPYEGAKPYFLVEDVEKSDALLAFIRATCDALPPPKPKRKNAH